MKRILIVTDSLGAPRDVNGEKIEYEDTWIYKLKNNYINIIDVDVIFITINGLDSNQLLQLTNDKLKLYNADLILFQFGIVDCAPRVLRNIEIKIISILKLSGLVKKIISKYHSKLSNLRNIQSINIYEFEQNVKRIYEILSNIDIKVIHIPIAPPCSKYIQHSPYINKNINNYNNILKKYSDIFLHNSYLDIEIENIFLSDLHHLNKLGHELLFKNIKNSIKNLIGK